MLWKLEDPPHGALDVIKVSSKLVHNCPSPCEGRNTKVNRVTLEAQLQLIVKLYLGDQMNEGMKGLAGEL